MRRDEVSRLEAAVRDANPVPTVEDLVDSDATAAVTLLIERRRGTLTATPTQTAPQPTGPRTRPHRSRAWAFAAGFVVILFVVGAAAEFLRGGDTPVADEPILSPTVTTSEAATTAVADDRELLTVVPGWQRIEDFWLKKGGWVEPLSGGGFVAASSISHPDGARLEWSPDGLNWFDGDPQRLLPEARQMAVVGETVIVLGGDVDAPTLWIGDPKAGSWRQMVRFDTSGLEETLMPGSLGLTAGNGAVLVSAVTETEDYAPTPKVRFGSLVVWLVDLTQETATRSNLALDPPMNQEGWGTVWEGDHSAWFDGDWHAMMSWVLHGDGYWTEHVLWSSPDGERWAEEELPAGWQPANVTCEVIEGKAWVLSNQGDWELVDSADTAASCTDVFSDGIGFVLDISKAGFVRLLPDGATVEELPSPFPATPVVASGNNLIVEACIGSEYTAEECAGYRGLWLYHLPDDK